MEFITLDLVPGKIQPVCNASQYDAGRQIGINVTENGAPFNLLADDLIIYSEKKPDGNIVTMDVAHDAGTSFVFVTTEQMTAVTGSCICQFTLKRDDVKIGSLDFFLIVEADPTDHGVTSHSEINNLERQVDELVNDEIDEILDDYYTKSETYSSTEIDDALDLKADKATTYNKTEVNNALDTKMDKNEPRGTGSFAVGHNVTANGAYSHAEGSGTNSSNSNSHAEGQSTTASGWSSHAEGQNTTASGSYSHSEGFRTIANHRSQSVSGEYNVADTSTASATTRGNYVEIVGNGADSNNRSNARTLDWSGNEVLSGDLTFNGSTSLTSELARLDNEIDNLPTPMVFKGTLGAGGTITVLPSASASNEGYTYKVITDGTYQGIVCKVGDVVTSNGSEWVLIPSGDTDSDTWRAIKINGTEKLSSAISSGAVDFEQGDNITITFDADGNKIIVATTGIYTKAEVDALIAGKCDYPTETASGAIASFNTDLASALKECEVSFTAYQASGTPTPSTSIPISGFSSATVFRTGRNMMPPFVDGTYSLNGITATVSNGKITITGQKNISGAFNLTIPLSTNFIIKNSSYIHLRNSYANSGITVTFVGWAYLGLSPVNRIIQFSADDKEITGFNIYFAGDVTETLNFTIDLSIEATNGTTTYEAYNGTSVLIPFSDTYYGLNIDIVKGKGRVTHQLVNLGSLTYARDVTEGKIDRYRTNELATLIKRGSGVTTLTIISDIFVANENPVYNRDIDNVMCVLNSNGNFYISCNGYTSAANFKTAMNGHQLVYELATPIEIDLTPAQIATLVGDNNVFCDISTSSVDVAFKVSIEKYINDLLNP